jgi:hypothetical protein
LLDAFEPWMTYDLEPYLTSIGEMFTEYEEFAADLDDGTPGWVTWLDPDRCPSVGLPFLAQIVGERLPVGITDAEARQWIKDNPYAHRGTIRSMALAGRRTLTGTKTLTYALRQMPDGTAHEDHVTIATYSAETPNSAVVLNDILSMSPADIQVHYFTLSGPLWSQVAASYPTWAAVKAAFGTWGDLANSTLGWDTFVP